MCLFSKIKIYPKDSLLAIWYVITENSIEQSGPICYPCTKSNVCQTLPHFKNKVIILVTRFVIFEVQEGGSIVCIRLTWQHYQKKNSRSATQICCNPVWSIMALNTLLQKDWDKKAAQC